MEPLHPKTGRFAQCARRVDVFGVHRAPRATGVYGPYMVQCTPLHIQRPFWQSGRCACKASTPPHTEWTLHTRNVHFSRVKHFDCAASIWSHHVWTLTVYGVHSDRVDAVDGKRPHEIFGVDIARAHSVHSWGRFGGVPCVCMCVFV